MTQGVMTMTIEPTEGTFAMSKRNFAGREILRQLNIVDALGMQIQTLIDLVELDEDCPELTRLTGKLGPAVKVKHRWRELLPRQSFRLWASPRTGRLRRSPWAVPNSYPWTWVKLPNTGKCPSRLRGAIARTDCTRGNNPKSRPVSKHLVGACHEQKEAVGQ